MRVKSSISAASDKNAGPGQGKYKAKVGNPIDLGLSSQSKVDGGTMAQISANTGDMTQRPKTMVKSVSSDRGTFSDLC
jgi:hypothetical protein